jgi:hypothetical protein
VPYYKFGPDDLIYNTVKVYPRENFFIYQNAIYYNNTPEQAATRGATTVTNVPVGYTSLYELNIDRPESEFIYPFITKDGSLSAFKTISKSEFNTDFQYGDTITGSYPLSASISRNYYSQGQDRNRIEALQTSFDYYKTVSRHYSYTSSLGDKSDQAINLISIPSIFYGDSIKKRTVELNFYVTGTLTARLKDIHGNGELIQVSGAANNLGSDYGSGSVAGVVFYNEGFIALTGSWDLDPDHTENYIGSAVPPRWIYYGVGAETASLGYSIPDSSFELKFSGSSTIPRMTMFARAERGSLNFSSNPTFVASASANIQPTTGTFGYVENGKKMPKNIVSGSYSDYNAEFEKITYVSKIGIYDEDKNLIGIAKLATPIKKTEERDLTFKLKLDI